MKIVFINKNIQIKNEHIIGLFLFQYSIPMILTRYYSPTLITMISTMALMLLSLLLNRFRFKHCSGIYAFSFVIGILSIKCLFSSENGFYPLLLFLEIAGPVLIVLLNEINCEVLLNFLYKLAYINFFAICLYPFMGEFAYMRFGYGMLLTVSVIYVKVFSGQNKQNFFDLLLLALSFLMMLAYGSRGATFAFLILIAIDRIVIKRKRVLQNLFIFLMGGLVLLKFNSLLSSLQLITSKVGVRTYSLSKLQMQLEQGLEAASSGRFYIYSDAINKIKSNLLFGVPLDVKEETGWYAHNLFLQAGLDFGIFGIIILTMLLFFMLALIKRESRDLDKSYVLALFFAIAIGRLMLSSIIWRRPEFWMLLFIFIALSRKHKNFDIDT